MGSISSANAHRQTDIPPLQTGSVGETQNPNKLMTETTLWAVKNPTLGMDLLFQILSVPAATSTQLT